MRSLKVIYASGVQGGPGAGGGCEVRLTYPVPTKSLFRKAVLGPVFPLTSFPGKCKDSWLFKVDQRSWRAEASVCSREGHASMEVGK